MRAARAVIVWLLLPAAIAGALTLSAAATIALAEDAGIPAGISPAAVGMLEIVSLTGTLLWVVVDNATLRRDAVLATVAASLVSLVAGFHAYGLFGAVAPLALVGVVHLASRAWRESWSDDSPVQVTDGASDPVDVGDEDEQEPARPARVLDLVRERELEPADEVDPQLARARQLVEQGAGRPTLRRELGVTDHRARQLLAEARQAVQA